MDRKELIRLYLEADTTVEQERELYDSFASMPPADDEEEAVFRMMNAILPVRLSTLPEADEEYDRMVKPSRMRSFRTWGISLAGIAAVILTLVFLVRKPGSTSEQEEPQYEYMDVLQQIAFISNFDPGEADNLEFRPVGDGFVMTAHFPDGQTASFMVTPLDGGKSFNLVSFNQ